MTVARKDYYETLGVSRTASDDEIKRSFKKLARKYHPDLNPGDKGAEQRFKEIAEAYAVLSDSEKRKRYDQYGFDGATWDFKTEGFDFSGFDFSNIMDFDFSDLFSNITGNRKAKQERTRSRGEDIQYSINISLFDALRGLSTRLVVNREKACSVCSGLGRLQQSTRKTCSNCGGSGRTVSGHSLFKFETTCPRCGGTGKEPGPLCKECHGKGTVTVKEKISIKIPPGVDNGSRVRVAKKGNAGMNGGETGDLYIIPKIQEHSFFKRKGHNLYCTVLITIAEAALGAKIEVPTVDGTKSRIKVPPGTGSGQRFRLRGKGMPALRSSERGDMFVKVEIVLPRVLDEKSKSLLREFAKLNSENPRDSIKT